MARGRSRADDLLVAERRDYVFRLKQAGATYRDISRAIQRDAQWIGRLPKFYTERQVYHDVQQELQRYRASLAERVEDIRQLELARLDRLLLAYWQRALGQPEQQLPGDPDAARLVLQLMERRARYLPGLDAPRALAPTTPDGSQPWEPTVGLAALLEVARSSTNGTHPDTPTLPEAS